MVGKAEMNEHVFFDLASRIPLIKNMTQKPKLPSPVSSMRISDKFTIIRYSNMTMGKDDFPSFKLPFFWAFPAGHM